MSMAEAFKYRAFLSYAWPIPGGEAGARGASKISTIDKGADWAHHIAGPIPTRRCARYPRPANEFEAGDSLASRRSPALDGSPEFDRPCLAACGAKQEWQ